MTLDLNQIEQWINLPHSREHAPSFAYTAAIRVLLSRVRELEGHNRTLIKENSLLRAMAPSHEVDRERAEAYEKELKEIGRIIGCDHIHDGIARCVAHLLDGRPTHP